MDDFLNKSILFDIYGNILKDNQKKVYEYHIIDDLSFNEIGEILGLTRQDCYDLFSRADKKLNEIDTKLNLKTKFINIENFAIKINQLSKDKDIKSLSNKIINITKNGGKYGSKNQT